MFDSIESLESTDPLNEPHLERRSTLQDIHVQIRKYTIYTQGEIHDFESLEGMITELKKNPDLLKENLWVDFENISKREKEVLCKMFNLSQSTRLHIMEDTPSRLEERYELISNYLHISLHPVDQDESFLLFVVTRNVILTFRDNPYANFSQIYKIVRDNKPKDINTFSPDWILHCWLDVLTEEYLKPCNTIFEECEESDELTFTSPSRKIPELSKKMQSIQKKVIQRRIDLVNILKIFDFLTKENLNTFISKHVAIYFKDLRDQISFMIDKIGFSRDILIQAQSSLLSRSAIEAHESTHNGDRFMELINGLALIALPFSIVSGFLGMNVQVPFQTTEGDTDIRPFIIVIGTLIFLGFSLVYISKVYSDSQKLKKTKN